MDQLNPEDREEVRNAEAVQRQVTGRVNDPAEGLHEKVERYLRDQQNLKIDNAEARDQMRQLLAGLDRVRDDHLVPAEQGLDRANKALDQSPRGEKPADQADQPKGEDAQNRQGEEAGEQAKSQGGEQSKSQAGQQSKSQNGEQSKSQAGEQSKSQAGEQSKSQAGEQSKSQAGEQAQPPQGGEPSKEGQQPDARKPEDEPTKAGQELALAEKQQKAIADELQRMLDSLNEFETMRGVLNEAKGLLKEERETMKAAAEEIEKNDLDGKTLDQLPPEQKAATENLGRARRSSPRS